MPTSLSSSTSLLALILAADLGGSRATWAPEVNEVVEWSWHVEQELELGKMSIQSQLSGGRAFQVPYSNFSFCVRDELELRVRDRLLARSDEGPESLHRVYARARRATHVQRDSREEELVTASRLEESAVCFERIDEDDHEELRIEPAEGESIDEAWLEGLDEELDLRGFLDGDRRERGERWLIGDEAIRCLLQPGGNLSLTVVEEESSETTSFAELGWLSSATLLDRESYVFGRAKYAKVVTDRGRRYAQIDLEIRVEAEGDVHDRMTELTEGRSRARSWVEYVGRAELEQATVLRGELYWDLEAQRADSLDLRGDLEAFLEVEYDMSPIGREDICWLMTAELRGELRIEVRSSRSEDED